MSMLFAESIAMAADAQVLPTPEREYALGENYRTGNGVAVNTDLALQYYLRAATHGYQPAVDKLAILMFETGLTTDVGALDHAASRGDGRALYLLGKTYLMGDGVPRDPLRGYAYLQRAANAGEGDASAMLDQVRNDFSDEDRREALRRYGVDAPKPQLAERMTEKPKAEAAPSPRAELPPPVKVAMSAPPSPQPSAAPSAARRWRLQIGSFKSEARAQENLKALRSKQGPWKDLTFTVPKIDSLWRIRTNYIATRAKASAICGQISASGFDCLVLSSDDLQAWE